MLSSLFVLLIGITITIIIIIIISSSIITIIIISMIITINPPTKIIPTNIPWLKLSRECCDEATVHKRQKVSRETPLCYDWAALCDTITSTTLYILDE